ncbi:MAG: hypothetical protein CM1200mP27_05250 [Chloroflexota bacterium]|nr:MAG: hypothetical protein CM1200mP27_05250 [Chloroflexota bacterium]
MEYGFYLPNSGAGVEPNALSDIAKLGDRLGFFCMVCRPRSPAQPGKFYLPIQSDWRHSGSWSIRRWRVARTDHYIGLLGWNH